MNEMKEDVWSIALVAWGAASLIGILYLMTIGIGEDKGRALLGLVTLPFLMYANIKVFK